MKIVSEQGVPILLGISGDRSQLCCPSLVQLLAKTNFGDFIVLVPQKEGHWLSQLGSASPYEAATSVGSSG